MVPIFALTVPRKFGKNNPVRTEIRSNSYHFRKLFLRNYKVLEIRVRVKTTFWRLLLSMIHVDFVDSSQIYVSHIFL